MFQDFDSILFVESDENGVMKKILIKYDDAEYNNRINNGLTEFSAKYRDISEPEFVKLLDKYYKWISQETFVCILFYLSKIRLLF